MSYQVGYKKLEKTMNVKIALPGDKYYSVPVEVLEKYSVSKDEFEKSLIEEEPIFDDQEDDVTGQGVRG